MNRADRYARAASVLWQRTSKRVVINQGSGLDTFELDGVAALVWDALDEPAGVEELVVDLAAVFEQPADVVRPELVELLAKLVASGAVRVAE